MSRLATAAILFALSVPPLAAAQSPIASGQAHPSATAHATALAGQAAATRIEACVEATDAFIDNLQKSDFKTAASNFDARMAAALDSAKLGEVWQSMTARYGKLESRGTAQNVIYQGLAVVTVPLRFQNGTLGARLACGADGRFSGFHIVPPPAAASAPASSN
ncbi:MAG TPA: DUF3887 domain-containing protein [Rhodanobacteraceae bacterium]|nr:DUF3887 domain-containing protein [Rhodanobacteraceae bacterium]